jgi:hypothetical protein
MQLQTFFSLSIYDKCTSELIPVEKPLFFSKHGSKVILANDREKMLFFSFHNDYLRDFKIPHWVKLYTLDLEYIHISMKYYGVIIMSINNQMGIADWLHGFFLHHCAHTF